MIKSLNNPLLMDPEFLNSLENRVAKLEYRVAELDERVEIGGGCRVEEAINALRESGKSRRCIGVNR